MNHTRVVVALFLLFTASLPVECITGGNTAVAHSRPYMASIQWDGKHQCGGFLISSQWIMSAAHCFQDKMSGVKVVLGAHSLSAKEDTEQTFNVAQFYNHPEFNKVNYDNDIALLKLEKEVSVSNAVKPVKYLRDKESSPKKSDDVETAGWGALNNLGRHPDELQELRIPVMDRFLCGRSDYYGAKFTRNMLCAAAIKKDTCNGDSGGPLLFQGMAVGIISNGGKKCGTNKKPGLYTIIPNYTQWIDRTITQ